MANNKTPTVVKQVVFNTDEISRIADPEWPKSKNYGPSYKFAQGRRKFVDHRDKVYVHPKADE